tara:strand:- start:35 stop:412 length:378 start_codon:yes stop_codon:yes gene_type:complete
MKTLITIFFARLVKKRNNKWISNPIETQAKTFNKLLLKGTKTEFGRDHNFSIIKNYEDFKNQVPIRDYEGLKPYVDKVVKGEKIYFGLGNPFILQKPVEQHLVQNIYLSQENQLKHILIQLVMPC